MSRLYERTPDRPVRWRARVGAVALVGVLTPAISAAAGPPAPRVASYEIDARLEPDARSVRAHQILRWRNTTTLPASALYFHLYLNAFANNRTTLMRETRDAAARWMERYPGEWGNLDVTAIRLAGADVTGRLEAVAPDDHNPFDRTVVRLPLDRPVEPGAEISVEFDFVARLPRLFMRAGHAAPFFFVAQWFPKVAVFENGRWRCQHYHESTEFYADFGIYDVRLTVPSDYVLGHTGIAASERDNGDGTKTVAVHAEDVHDFAWTADPRFRVVEETIDGVRVRLLIQPGHLPQTERYLGGLRAALTRYADWFGPYPYPVLTVVDPGPGGLAAGGMEYPMLITVGTTWWMPRGLREPEQVAVHEFGHQYWYGIVANNELDEAWLDEGINSYVEGRIMDEAYGPGSVIDFLGLRVGAVSLQRFGYLAAPSFDPITRPAYDMLDHRSYRSVTYSKTALVLDTLDRQLGGNRLRDALRAYYQAWRFRHPTGADWRASIAASVGESLDGYFAQTLDGTGVLDYAVESIDVYAVPPAVGIGLPAAPERPADRDAVYHSEVVVTRRGDVRMPVEIVIGFEDGSETRERWDGVDRWHRFESEGATRAAYAIVDPGNKLPLDVDRLNNSRMVSPGTAGIVRIAGRWGLWLQNFLHALTSF